MTARAFATERLATEVRVLLHPFATFAELADDPQEGVRRLAARVALLLFVVGVGVSVLTCGRVVPHHVVGSVLAWSFAPLIQLFAAAAGLFVTGRGSSPRRALSVYAAGNGPWLIFFVLVPFGAVLAPSGEAVVRVGIERGMIPILLGLALFGGVFLTYTFHRAAMRASRRRAAAATLLDLLLKVLLSLVWFGSIDNLVPQLFGPGR